jgi:hypothetical protein
VLRVHLSEAPPHEFARLKGGLAPSETFQVLAPETRHPSPPQFADFQVNRAILGVVNRVKLLGRAALSGSHPGY